MKTYRIAAMGGDGIGPEVVEAGVQVLNVCAERDGGFKMAFTDFDWGSDYYRKHGVMMPADGADQLRKFDAILFGAVGAPDIPDHITLWGSRLAICQPLDQYANVRPTRILPGITSPLRNVSGPELDWVIVRENSEGEYSGVGGRVHKGLPEEVATDVSMMTRPCVARIMRFAFKLAQSRPRKLLTVVTKSNAQRHAMVMWDEIAAEVAKEFPDVTWDKMLVDAMTMRMIMRPADLGHDRGHEPARGYSLRSRRGACWLARHRADRKPQSGTESPVHVRADPRLGLRHYRQGHRQSGSHVLDRGDDAGASERETGGRPADEGGGARDSQQVAAHA
jgi:tartrate dehydrogenase/decarboxylase / D-malate dehydrogenase